MTAARVGSGIRAALDTRLDTGGDRPAVRARGTTVSYAALDEWTSVLADRLTRAGIGPGHVVAICLPRSIDLVVAIMGVLRAGAAFSCLPLGGPAARREVMARESRACLAIAGSETDGLDALSRTGAMKQGGLVARPAGPARVPPDTAYVMFTSGSTGVPKAVPITDAGLTNRIAWMQDEFELHENDRVLQKTPCTFDVSVWEFLWPLAVGAQLVMAAEGGHLDASYLRTVIDEQQVTTVHFVPSMLEVFLDALPAGRDAGASQLPSLRRVILSGEQLQGRLVARAFAALPAVEMHNLYGPTEAAIDVTHWRCDPGADPAAPVPIGFALPGVLTSVVDAAGRPVPSGTPGELLLAGVQVTRGYLNSPEANRRSFVPSMPTGSPLRYRTGDVVTQRADGALLYQGRIDDQIKIAGVRIEPGEVEATLLECPGVDRCLVGMRSGPGDELLLVAWLVASGARPEDEQVRDHLARRLPGSHVPAALVWVDSLPTGAHGKIDRAALPWAVVPAAREMTLAEVWSQATGAPARPDADLFACGVSSLAVVRLVAQVQALTGRTVPLLGLLTEPTFAHLERLVQAAPLAVRVRDRSGRPAAERALSSGQQRMWLIDKMHPGNVSMNIIGGLCIEGDVDDAAVVDAFRRVLGRHDILRSYYPETGGEAAVAVLATDQFDIDVGSAPRTDQDPADFCEQAARALGTAGYDLAAGPLVRARLHTLGDRLRFLAIGMHHIVTDGWSWSVLSLALARHLAEPGGGGNDDAPVQFADHVADEQAGGDAACDAAYWAHALADAPEEVTLATRAPSDAAFVRPAATCGFELGEQLAASVRESARAQGVSVFALLLAAFGVVIVRRSGRDDVVVSSPVATRRRADVEDLVGYFVNTVPLRLTVEDDTTFAQLCRAAHRASVEALAHSSLPYEQIVSPSAQRRGRGLLPHLRTMFVVQNTPPWTSRVGPVTVTAHEWPSPTIQYDLKMEVQSLSDAMLCRVVYAADAFRPDEVRTIASQFCAAVSWACAAPQVGVFDYPLGAPARLTTRVPQSAGDVSS